MGLFVRLERQTCPATRVAFLQDGRCRHCVKLWWLQAWSRGAVDYTDSFLGPDADGLSRPMMCSCCISRLALAHATGEASHWALCSDLHVEHIRKHLQALPAGQQNILDIASGKPWPQPQAV